jgi:hypothetical protein
VHFNVNWASQEVPFPKFGIKLREGQSADAFMVDVEKRVTLMICEYTMNEYKAYKALVKHKRKINHVFSEICGDKAFPSRRPGRKLKIPAVAVASCSVAPPKAPRRRSSKSGPATADEATSSGIRPTKTKSLESSKRKRKSSGRLSDAKLQAASSLAGMSRKKSKKAVKKVVSSEVRRVPSAFDDNLFMEPASQKRSHFWPLLRFNFREHCPSGSENEFVDIDSFSDAAPEVQKEVVPDVAAEPPVTATVAIVPQSVHPHDESSPEFTKELELTIHRGEDPVQGAPLLEIHEKVPKGQAPSPSLAAFNKSFGTSHCGELLSVDFEVVSIGNGASRILTLWKSPTLVDETGEEALEQTSCLPGEVAQDSEKGPHSALRKTSASLGKSSSNLEKKVTLQNLSKQGSFLFVNSCASHLYDFFS